MLKNTVSILITVGVLIAIAITLKLINNQEKSVSEAIMAIPEDAAVVIETNKFYTLLNNFNNKNQFRNEFLELEQLKDFFSNSEYLDSLIGSNTEFKNLIEGKRIIISGHITANNNMEYLYVVPFTEKKSFESVHKTIGSLMPHDATIRQILYEGFTEYSADFYNEESKLKGFSYAFANNLFIFSTSKTQTEAALRRLKSNYSLLNDKPFRKLMESAGKNVDANIYINYKYLPNIGKNVLKNGNNDFYNFITTLANWSEFDLILKDDAFLMSGFTFADDSLNQYLNVFKGQSAVENEFLDFLPGNTSAFVAFNLSDPLKWKDAFFKYLQKLNDFSPIEEKLKEFNKRHGDKKSDFFYKNLEGCVAVVWTNAENSDAKDEAIIVMQIRDADLMEAEFEMIRKKDTCLIQPRVIDQNNGIKAVPFTRPRLFSYLFGSLFNRVNAAWYINYKGYFVFAPSVDALQNYVRYMRSGQRLRDDVNFNLFSKSISSESNLFIYSHIASSKNIFTQELNDKFLKIYSKNQEKFDKIKALAIQYGSSGNKISTNVYFNIGSRTVKSGKNVWEVPLDGPFSMKPQIVKNHTSGNNEVILQDDAYNLMLISETGKVLWKRKLSGKILGEIHQIDFYKSNKLQFLFNTRENLYLIDRNGKDVEDYPIKLKSPATNGMSVFDYDNDRTYRILIACENKNVYLLNTAGSKVDGWAFGQTESEVVLPAQHFVANGKDYIIFADKNNTYIVNRRGEKRIDVKQKFEKNPQTPYFFEKGQTENDNMFLTTVSNGDIYFILTSGEVRKLTIEEFSPNHRFIFADLDGDGKNQFIFADKNKLFVYNRDKSLRFEEKFDGQIGNSLNLYKIVKNVKYIGLAPEGSGRIYLLNTKGEKLKGFPLQGKGAFSIARLIQKGNNNELNLITGSDENFLLNYKLGVTEPEAKQE